MDHIKKLESLGLSSAEASVYTASLKLGTTRISEIARSIDIPRTSIYIHTQSLVEKGFLTKSKRGNIEYFTASDPELVLKETQEKIEIFADVVPYLKGMVNLQKGNPKIEFYETKDGLLKLYEKLLNIKSKHPVRLIESGTAVKKLYEVVGWDFVYKWHKRMLEKEAMIKGMSTADILSVLKETPEKIKKIIQQRAKYISVLDTGEFTFPINLYLIHPNIVFVVVPQDLFVLTIENKNIYTALLLLFEELYKKTKTVQLEL